MNCNKRYLILRTEVFFIALCICLLGGKQRVSLAAQNNYVAEVEFASGVSTGKNLSLVVSKNADAITEETTKDGMACRKILAGNYGYFQADDLAIKEQQKDLFFEVTYYDEGVGNMALQYNSTEHNYTSIHFPKNNTKMWVTATLCVGNAAFKNAQNQASDFRISGESYIKSVKIYFGKIDLASNDFGKRTGGSAYSELTDKSVAGYQAWFTTGGENEKWTHWGRDEKWPRKDNHTIDFYPYVKDYNEVSLRQTGFANLGSGEPAKLFASKDQNVIDTHFSWMKEYGIDGAALQVFSSYIESRTINGTPEAHYYSKIKKAAEDNQRIFYIMYDISGGKSERYVEDMKFDWIYNVEQGCELLKSDSYATVNGKPVVCIWGMGVGGRPTDRYEEIIDFFQKRDCYVILGTNDDWRTTGTYLNTFKKADAISPWYVGRFGSNAGVDDFYNRVTWGDIDYCKANRLDYYPVIWSGFSWTTWNNGAPNTIPRNAGQFLWHQVYKLKEKGIKSLYIAMFDEYDEGTAIMKNASDYFDIPTDQYFVTASADGYWLSNDFQLRVVGAAIEMAKGRTPLTDICSVEHSQGPVYYRNSFEMRYLKAEESKYSGDYPIDPCFKNPQQVSASFVNNAKTEIVQTDKVKSGNYAVKVSGKANANSASYYYKIADAKIKVKNGMKLTYSILPENNSGRNVIVSLLFDDGTRLCNTSLKDQDGVVMSAKNPRGAVGAYKDVVCSFGNAFAGKYITGIEIGYEGNQTGDFSAYVDNILIEDGEDMPIEMDGTFQRTDVDGYIDFSGSVDKEEGIQLVRFSEENMEGYTFKTRDALSNQLVIPATKYAYFKADENLVEAEDDTLKIGVTYFDEGNGNIVLEYNAIKGTENTGNANYAKVMVKATGTGEWKTEVFQIDNANFRKAQNNGADFRISRYESGVQIKDVFLVNDTRKQIEEGSFSRIDVDGYIDFSGRENKEEGIGLVVFAQEDAEGYTYKQREGATYDLVIPATKYAYFKADTNLVAQGDNALEIGVTYLDIGKGNIALEYNAIEGTQNTKNANYARVMVQGTGTGEWKTEIFRIDNANFRKAQNNGADFRISRYESGVSIKDVFIINDTADAYIDFSEDLDRSKAIELVTFANEGAEGYTYRKKEDAMNQLVIPATKYAYFKADASCIQPGDKELEICVTYLDIGTGNIALEYNAIEGTQNTKNANYARVLVKGTNTGTWKTETFRINNANFRKAQNNGADFRISRYESGVSIKRISISKN